MLKCNHCQSIFIPKRTNNKNPQKFCSMLCSSESSRTRSKHKCDVCDNITTNPKFCSQSCAAKFNNAQRLDNGYTVTKEHKLKTSASLKGKYKGNPIDNRLKWTTPTNNIIFYEITGPFTKLYLCKCKFTGTYFVSKTLKTILPRLARTKKEYSYACRFTFGISSYPEWFSCASTLISEFGWYSTPGSARSGKLNTTGISRDHMVSMSYGFKNNIPPHIISHPANCELLQHTNNQHKNKKCSISIEELYIRIEKFNALYPASPFGVEPKPLVLETSVPPATLRTCTIH